MGIGMEIGYISKDGIDNLTSTAIPNITNKIINPREVVLNIKEKISKPINTSQ